MNSDLQRDLMAALERPHRLGTIGGDLEEQLAHCASFSSVLGQVVSSFGNQHSLRGIDLGTGGGLPGVALAGAWPTMMWTLVDVRAARIAEVERTVLGLGYDDRVVVIAGEAQQLGHDPRFREQFDVAVARSFGPPSITAECAAGLVAVGGVFIVSEPPDGSSTDRWDETGLAALGFGPPKIIQHQPGGNGLHHQFAVFTKQVALAERLPRLPARANRGWVVGST